MTLRRICVVTGSRADYGLLERVMLEIKGDADLQLQVVATGMHLSPEFGMTYREIEAAGFTIDVAVEMLVSSDSPVGVTKSIGLGVSGFADALAALRPDIMVVLGDRFEILAAVQAALIARVPVAHIHGGETTEGAVDESIRHAITKLSHWHFVAAPPYRDRVVQLGESPERVFDFGAPGLDQLESVEWMSRPELEASLSRSLGSPLFLVTYHPATLGTRTPVEGLGELLAALEDFPGADVVFTYPNADMGGRELIAAIEQWVGANQDRSGAFVSLGQRVYLSLVREADVMVGNSSSGLIEAAAMKTAVVNIGDRQAGRLRASSVIDAAEHREAIASAIRTALSAEFRAALASTRSPYGSGDVSRRIKEALKTVDLETRKKFFDISHEH